MRWSQHLPQGPIPCPLWLPPPARISWNGVYSCPEMPRRDVWPKHQLPFTGGPQYQRKNYRPAAGRGMNPRQCVKIMWGLVNRHGQGMRHSLSHGIRHTTCRKDNRWHENPLFSLSSSRRSYWWETRQNFPESQSLSKELLHFHDSESKYFWSVSITLASPAAEDSPHLLHMVTSQSYSQSMKTLTTGCYHFSILISHWYEVVHLLVMAKSSGFQSPTSCWHHPPPLLKFVHFSLFMKSVLVCHCVVPPGLAIYPGRLKQREPARENTELCRTRRCSWL